MIIRSASGTLLRSGTVIRPYSPAGLYWKENFSTPAATYVNESDLIFTACHFDEEHHSGDYYSEFDEPSVEELRLIASLILPIGNNCGILPFYPLLASIDVEGFAEPCSRDSVTSLSVRLRATCEGAGGGPRKSSIDEVLVANVGSLSLFKLGQPG